MDQETFFLLMQVMFGDHHQRQKANFKLRRKGVSNKIRLKAKHKGPGARLSLKRALRDAIHQYEFEQRHKHPRHTASAFSTRTAQNRNYDSFAKPQSGRPSSGPPRMDPNAPMRRQGTITTWDGDEYGKNWAGWVHKNIDSLPFPLNFIGGSTYDAIDAAYVSFFSLQRGRSRVNLEGEVVFGSQITDAGVETLINAVSVGIPYTKVFKLKGLNAAQFSKMLKGSFINRLKPGTRGFINRMFNKVYTKQQKYYMKGLLGSPSFISDSLRSNGK